MRGYEVRADRELQEEMQARSLADVEAEARTTLDASGSQRGKISLEQAKRHGAEVRA